jgi:hypothetical protein
MDEGQKGTDLDFTSRARYTQPVEPMPSKLAPREKPAPKLMLLDEWYLDVRGEFCVEDCSALFHWPESVTGSVNQAKKKKEKKAHVTLQFNSNSARHEEDMENETEEIETCDWRWRQSGGG